jgi:predicted PurR-regulated permease PerM
MKDLLTSLRPWIVFGGCVLVVFVLHWAQAVLVPLALAVLFAFVLATPVNWLQRWFGRVLSVIVVVALVFAGVMAAGWGVTREIASIANDLPAYRLNIRQKIADLRGAEHGGAVEKLQRTIDDIKSEIAKTDDRVSAADRARSVVVVPEQVAGWWGFPTWLSPAADLLATLSLVSVMTVFMLIERQELRARLIRLFGSGRLAVTTRALDEAATRVSRHLLMQTLVNVTYGLLTGVGLWAIGVPFAMLWAALAGILRFVPYAGPVIGATGPILLSLAALPGWIRPLEVVGLFVGLELFTNLVLETILYAGAAGVSQVALLVAIAFWTWLWGPFGLLMATPLTVCLVVLGRHVAGLELLATLMADEPALSPSDAYYQRLIASDQSEAWDLLQQHIASLPPETVFDALMLPAVARARRDREDERLTPEDESSIQDATRELLGDLRLARHGRTFEPPVTPETAMPVLAFAASDGADEVALEMLQELIEDQPIAFQFRSGRMLSAEVVSFVQEHDIAVVCIADLPPNPTSKTRYLVRRLHAALPSLTILVGRWAPPEIADADADGKSLCEAGATQVSTTMLDTATHLRALAAQYGARSATANEDHAA